MASSFVDSLHQFKEYMQRQWSDLTQSEKEESRRVMALLRETVDNAQPGSAAAAMETTDDAAAAAAVDGDGAAPAASATDAAPTVETAPRLRDEAVADAPTPAPGEPHSRLSSVPSSKSSSALWRQEHACVVELVARSQAEVPRPAEGPAVA